jgi:hypothetical protein
MSTTHASQMNADVPAMSFATALFGDPQNEQLGSPIPEGS